MPGTKISDILTPDVWNQYGRAAVLEKNAFWQSGIVARVDDIQLPAGGATVNMPFFGRIDGDPETLTDTAALSVDKISANKQVAVVVARGKAWGASDLAGLLAGADPLGALIEQLAEYWAAQDQKELVATLTGVFKAASMDTNRLDVSGESGDAGLFSAKTFIDATARLGDAKAALSTVAMHSAVEAKLAKDDLIQYHTVADKSDRVPFYLGKRVIVDDALPLDGDTATSYIFGPGAVGFADAQVGAGAMERDRDILAGEDVVSMRRRWILHVKGTRWKGTAAGAFPTREELAADNWERVFAPKQIPVVQFKARIA